MVRTKIILNLDTGWNRAKFRFSLIRALQAAGHDVFASASADVGEEGLPCRSIEFALEDFRTNPMRDVAMFLRFPRSLRREWPQVMLACTAKRDIGGGPTASLSPVGG